MLSWIQRCVYYMIPFKLIPEQAKVIYNRKHLEHWVLWNRRGELAVYGHGGTFWGDRNVLPRLESSMSCMGVYISQGIQFNIYFIF